MQKLTQDSFQDLVSEVSFSDENKHFFQDPKGRQKSRYIVFRGENYPKKILIHKSPYILTTDEGGAVKYLRGYSVLIEEGMITDVFLASKKKVDLNDIDMMYDASQRGGIVLTPGFINAHTHPPMYLLRSTLLEDGQQPLESALKHMAQLEGQMHDEDYFLGALGDFTEEQKTGITTTLSHYGVADPIEAAAKTAHQRVINALSAVSNSHPENTPQLVESKLKEKGRWTRPAIALHYTYKASPQILKKIATIQKKYKALLTIHCAESLYVTDQHFKKYGESEVETLHRFGLLGPRTVLSHCVYISDSDIDLLIKTKTGIVHLPTSNKIHKNDDFRYPDFYDRKGTDRIALGTDSVISKNSLDLVSEALQTRITHQKKRIVSFELLFKMMTSQAAEVVGMPKAGRIAPGYHADIAFWKLRDRGFIPFNHKDPKTLLANFLTFGGRNVRDLMVGGRFVISNRMHNMISETKLLSQTQLAHERLHQRIVSKD